MTHATRPLLFVLLLAACGRADAPPPGPVDLLAVPYQTLWLDPDDPGPEPATLDLTASTRPAGTLTATSSGDTLRAVATGGDTGWWRIPLPPGDPARWDRLCLRYRGSAGGLVRLGVVRAGEVQPTPLTAVTRGDGAWDPVCFWVARDLAQDEPIAAFTLHPPAGEIAEISLSSIRVHRAGAAAVATLPVDGRTRRGLALAPGAAAEWDLVVPTDATLEFGVALRDDARPGAALRVQLDDGSGFHTLWQRHLPAPRAATARWTEVRLDLADRAGARIRLRLEAPRTPDRADPFADVPLRGPGGLVVAAPRVATPSARPNLLFLVVDTLRGDAWEDERDGLVSRLEAALPDAHRYTRAYATASWTHPSVGSLLSGTLPPVHGLGTASTGLSSLRPDVVLLPEVLRASGYATAAVSNNPIVSPDEGLGRGFDHFDTRSHTDHQTWGARRVTTQALEWLDGRGPGPWFLYLHYFDPHDRYQAPPPYTHRYVDGDPSDEAVRHGQPNPLLARMHHPDGTPTGEAPSATEVDHLRGLYDAEVEYAADWIARLLERLRATGRLDNTVVVLTADHGEEFLEHGFLKHGHSLYEEQIRVPLWLHGPGVAPGTTDTPVSLVDVAPTLMAAAGAGGSARDLRQGAPGGPVFAITYPSLQFPNPLTRLTKQAVVEGDWKLHRYVEEDRVQLFDLRKDPGETTDVAAQHPEVVARLRDLVERNLGVEAGAVDAQGVVGPQVLEKLKALGYAH